MKNQINRILVALSVMLLVLTNIGYSAEILPDNRNDTDQSALNKTFAKYKSFVPPECTDVTANDILREINNSPETLKKQFRDGTITYIFAGKTLVFKGYVTGNGNNLRSLIGGFDKLRGEKCLRVISFEGDAPGSNFEWRYSDAKNSAPPTGCDVGGVIEKVVGEQLNKTFFYDYNENNKILEVAGHIGDAPGRGRFNSLIAQLQRFMKNGCIEKIAFVPKTPSTKAAQAWKAAEAPCITKISYVPETTRKSTMFFNRGFEWQICEYPSCECLGQCVPCANGC